MAVRLGALQRSMGRVALELVRSAAFSIVPLPVVASLFTFIAQLNDLERPAQIAVVVGLSIALLALSVPMCLGDRIVAEALGLARSAPSIRVKDATRSLRAAQLLKAVTWVGFRLVTATVAAAVYAVLGFIIFALTSIPFVPGFLQWNGWSSPAGPATLWTLIVATLTALGAIALLRPIDALNVIAAAALTIDPGAETASSTSSPNAQLMIATRLSPREVEVLNKLCEGMSNAEIAAALYVSTETVKSHVASILQKLGARDRTQAVAIALGRR